MASNDKGHLYETEDMIRSVLLGVRVKSVCGVENVLTRDGIDNPGDKGCGKCLHMLGTRAGDSQIVGGNGWVHLLEREMKKLLTAKSNTIRIRMNGSFPLAG